jgi:hypothetical protein
MEEDDDDDDEKNVSCSFAGRHPHSCLQSAE